MNRHFVNYAALPCAPLGEPIRKQAAKPSPETPWKPIPGHPDHVERINAQGAREVTHKDWVPAPSPPPAPAAPALDPGRVMPEDVHGSCLKPAPVDPLDDLAERVANDSGMYRRLIEHRGGCRCCVSPPCSACCEPLTQREAEVLGWLDEETATPPVVKRVAKPEAADVPEGATHRFMSNGLFYRHIRPGETFVWLNSAWVETTYHWSDEEMASGCFKRLPQPAAPTEWQSGPPPSVGWYDTDDGVRHEDIEPRHWNGSGWSYCPTANADIETKLGAARGERTSYIVHCWRGPRLVGPDWPEPQQ